MLTIRKLEFKIELTSKKEVTKCMSSTLKE
nr:MAG TPA: hypothetical protein [Caudoviricetes sp.]